MSNTQPAWFSKRTPEQRAEYAERFRRISERGEDIDGEARFVDAMSRRCSTILDAGCGVGRVAAALTKSGHQAIGIDADPLLITRGRELYPELPLEVLDLSLLDTAALREHGLPRAYDTVVCAGNVMHYLAPGSQAQVIKNLAAVLNPDGRMAIGFATGRGYEPIDLAADAEDAGLILEHRFTDWELRPDRDDADWQVSVFTKPRPDPAPRGT